MRYEVKLKNRWSKELAYLCGLITGDGSMPSTSSKRSNSKLQRRHPIYFYSTSLKFLREVYIPLFKGLFRLEPYIIKHKIGKNSIVYNCRIESMIIYNFLKVLGLKTGRKAKIAGIPKMPIKYKIYFLAGLLDTDGGKKGSGFGLSTASKKLARFCEDMFKALRISYHSCPWEYKGHVYHQVYVHKRNTGRLLETIPFKNIEKIKIIRSMCLSGSVSRALEQNSAKPW